MGSRGNVSSQSSGGSDLVDEVETPVLPPDHNIGAPRRLADEEEEVPFQAGHRVAGGVVVVMFEQMQVRFHITRPISATGIVQTLLPGANMDNLIAEFNGHRISRGINLQDTLVVRPLGLRGGAPNEKNEEAIRSMLSNLLQAKGLQGKILQGKLKEA